MEYRKGLHSIYDLKYHVVFCTKYNYPQVYSVDTQMHFERNLYHRK